MIYALQLDNSWEVLVYDLEGHGGTPTTPLSRVSIESLANDLAALIEHLGLEDKKWAGDITIITQGMGCLVALWYNHIISEQRRESMTASSSYLPSPKLAKIILLHPPPHPLPDHEKIELQKRAHTARTQGMRAIETKYTPHVSNETVQENPHAILALKYCLRATDVEGYAKACTALAEAPSMHDLKTELENVQVLIITGQHDRLATPNQCKKLAIEQLGGNAGLEVLPNVGAYCVLEDTQGLKGAIGGFLDA